LSTDIEDIATRHNEMYSETKVPMIEMDGIPAIPVDQWPAWIRTKEFKQIFPNASPGLIYTVFHSGKTANPQDKRNRTFTKAGLREYLGL